MSTQYLSYGIVGARTQPHQDPALLRTVELDRASERRPHWTRGALRRLSR